MKKLSLIAAALLVAFSASADLIKVEQDRLSALYSVGETASFKVTGDLQNGNPLRSKWLPLRWFVFQPDSFYQPGESDAFISRIEILDPYGKSPPGYSSGWYDWVQEHGWCPVFWAWDIEVRMPMSPSPRMSAASSTSRRVKPRRISHPPPGRAPWRRRTGRP